MSEKGEAELLEDFAGLVKLYSDGSVVRGDDSSFPVALSEHDNFNYKHVEYKDVVMDEASGLSARLYLPPETTSKAPVIMYFHGAHNAHRASRVPDVGGHARRPLRFSELQAGSRAPPSLCLRRFHRSAKVAKGAEPWMRTHADFSRVFLAGDSAGGNIAHHLGLWAAGTKGEIEIKELILMYPYFGGEERTSSEKENSSVFSLEESDALWRLALPVGSNRDHPFSNPLVDEAVVSAPDIPPMLFVIAGHDVLRHRQLNYCEFLKKCGKQIRVHVCDEEDHGFLFSKMEEPNSIEALRSISDFIK